MESNTMILGITLVVLVGLVCVECGTGGPSVKVEPTEIMVKPTPSNPTPEQIVNVTLSCTGSETDLAFYIKHSINWNFRNKDQVTQGITQGFYKAPNSEFADEHFLSKHFVLNYNTDIATNVFPLEINGVTDADNGDYECALKDGENVLSSKTLKLTVLHRVTSASITLMEAGMGKSLSKRTGPVNTRDIALELTPGTYHVICDAGGSNPAPIMELVYNDMKPTLKVTSTMSTDGARIKYSGKIMTDITLKASSAEQIIECRANIPNIPDQTYDWRSASMKVKVAVDKPIIHCANVTGKTDYRYQPLVCNMTTPQGGDGLSCDKVSWEFGDSLAMVRMSKDNAKYTEDQATYDIIDYTCEAIEGGLESKLTFHKLKPQHFEEIFYLLYGSGNDAHRHPVQIHFGGDSAASFITPMSLMACIVMALVSRWV